MKIIILVALSCTLLVAVAALPQHLPDFPEDLPHDGAPQLTQSIVHPLRLDSTTSFEATGSVSGESSIEDSGSGFDEAPFEATGSPDGSGAESFEASGFDSDE